ncbi:MAG: hypothetical protein ACXACG_13785 [Candidatus Thorarchaeota archaeon]
MTKEETIKEKLKNCEEKLKECGEKLEVSEESLKTTKNELVHCKLDAKKSLLTTKKEILLAEHAVFKEFFVSALGVAEKRVNSFVKMAGAAVAFVGGLVALSSQSIFSEASPEGDLIIGIGGYYQFLLLATFVSLILLVIGHSILVRVAYMNVNDEKWKKRMGLVRRKLRELVSIEDYMPFRADHPEFTLGSKLQEWGSGGLNDFMIKVNSVLCVIFFEFILEIIRYQEILEFSEFWWEVSVISVLVAGYIIGYIVQRLYISVKSIGWESDVSKYIKEIERNENN